MKEKFNILIGFLFFCVVELFGAPPKVEYYYVYDSTSKFTISDTQHFKWIKVLPNQQLKFGYNINATVWCKMVLPPASTFNDAFWLFDNMHLDEITLYKDGVKHKQVGDRTPFLSSFLFGQSFPIERFSSEHKPIIYTASVKKKHTTLEFSMDLLEREQLAKYSNRIIAAAFLFLGCSLLLIFLNGIILLKIRKKWNLLYLIYSIMGVIYVMVNMGILRNFIFPEFLYFSEMRIFSSTYWFLLMGLFLAETINFKSNNPRIYRFFINNQHIVFILSIVSIFLLYKRYYTILSFLTFAVFILFAINIVLLTVAVWYAKIRREPLFKFIVWSFVPHIIWGINMIFSIFGLGSFFDQTDWISWIVIYEMILFGLLLIKDYFETIKNNRLLENTIISNEKSANQSLELARLKERRNISDLLHDKISVDVARTIQSLDADESSKARAHIAELGKNIRNISHSILPIELEYGALSHAVSNYLDTLNEELNGIDFHYAEFDFPEHIERELALSLYLTLMEFIQNAMKHADAKNIRVELFKHSGELVFSVTDDGIGFFENKQYGFGLKNIQLRIHHLGGEFTVETAHQKGTHCMVVIPEKNTH